MTPENQLTLSFYKEIAVISKEHDVHLVQHVETGEIYIKKHASIECFPVYDTLQKSAFPSVPEIIELIPDADSLTIIEEYIHGKNLEQILEKRLFSEEETAHIIIDLCKILKPFHDHFPKIIHRDIKPSNLILEKHGHLYLIDFDAAKTYNPNKTKDTVLMGTVDYAAPEQYGFLQSDQRTDIYSIGILMNKMLTGSLPSETLAAGRLGKIIQTCTALNPDDRYASCDQLAQALKNSIVPPAAAVPVNTSNAAVEPAPKKKTPLQHSLVFLTGVFFTYVSMTTEFTQENNQPFTGYSLWVNRIGSAIALLLCLIYYTNYFNLRNRYPWKKKSSGIREAGRLLLGGFLCFLIPVVFVLFLE